MNERDTGVLDPPAHAPADGTLTQLVGGIMDDATKLIGQHIEMFKAELREDVSKTKDAVGLAGFSVVLFTVGGWALVFGLVKLLADLTGTAEWIWWGVVAAVFLIGGALCAILSKRLFQSFNPLPDKTFNALQENLSWITKGRK